MTMPKSHSKRLREIGDARRRQRSDQHDVDAGGDEAGLERGFEHVAGQARVLADEHRAALGREHARRGARQAQREIHGHRMFADPAANAVGAEILTCHRTPCLPAITAAAHARLASTVAATSWARTIRAPCRTAMAASATLPARRSSTARPESVAEHRLARQPDQHRHAQRRASRAGRRAARGCATSRLAEAETRIDDEPLARRCRPRGRRATRSARNALTSATTSS